MRARILALLAAQTCLTLTGLAVSAASSPAAPVAAPAPAAVTLAASRAVTVTVRAVTRAVPRPAPRPTSTPIARQHRPMRAANPTNTRPPQVNVPRSPTPPRENQPTTAQERVDAAIAKIPGYQATDATWLLQAKDGFWGTADWYHNVIWISPLVPPKNVYDVVIHEWSHLKSVQAYGGNVDLAVSEMNSYFGGSGLTGAERAADCMARLAGAGWTHYTDCHDTSWRAGAARLLAGRRL